MKKTISLAVMLAGCALAQDVCLNNVGSGCGQWWMNSSTAVDGTYNHSTGVSTAYTANYTNVTASQDSLNSIFAWTSPTNTANSQTVTTNNNFASVWSNLASTPAATANNYASSPYIESSSYSGYNSVSSFIPSNSGSSTPIMGGSTSTSSYEAYLAMVYRVSYGTPAVVNPSNPNVAVPNADPMPEPASVVSMGLGIAALAFMAHRRAKTARRK